MNAPAAAASEVNCQVHEENGGATLSLPMAPDTPGDGLRLWSSWRDHMHRHALDATVAALRAYHAEGEYPESGLTMTWRLFGDSLDQPATVGTAVDLKTGEGESLEYSDGSTSLRQLIETLEDFPTDVGFLVGLNEVFRNRVIRSEELPRLDEELLGAEWVATRAARQLSEALPEGRVGRSPRM